MSIKKITLSVTFNYELEIDEDNQLVKEYEGQDELLQELVDHKMSSVIAVMGNGVNVKSIDVDEWSSWDSIS